MNDINHEQAQELIEQPASSLTRDANLALHRHLESCEACRAYRREFWQREQQIRTSLQARYPAREFTPLDLHRLGKASAGRVRARQFQAWLSNGFQTLAWTGVAAALMFGLIWLINHTVLINPEPSTTLNQQANPSPTPGAGDDPFPESPPGVQNPADATFAEPPAPVESPTFAAPSLSSQHRVTFSGNGAPFTSLAFSPDGTLLAAGSGDGQVYVWRFPAGTLLYKLDAHEKEVTSMAFSPDGWRLATASRDGTVKFWGAESGTFFSTLLDDPGWVKSVTFSPDGQFLAVSLNEYRVMMFRVENGTLFNSSTAYTRFDVSNTGAENYVLASSETAVWLNSSPELPFGLRLLGQGGKSLDAVLSPEGRLLASGSTDQKVYLWEIYDVTYLLHPSGDDDVTTETTERKVLGSLIATLEGHTDRVNGVAFTPDGNYLVSGSGDATLIRWGRDGERLETLTGHTGSVNDVAISPDGTWIASASDDGTVKLWSFLP